MTRLSLSSFYEPERLKGTIDQVESDALSRVINNSTPSDHSGAIARLRVAAICAVSEFVSSKQVEEWVRPMFDPEISESATHCFDLWHGYLLALAESGLTIPVEDHLWFAVAGYLARRPNDVRDFMRKHLSVTAVDEYLKTLMNEDWLSRVRGYISLAIVLTIRQHTRHDLDRAGSVLRNLAVFQQDVEPDWLETREEGTREAVLLLAFYHAAEVVIKAAEFLLSGTVTTAGRESQQIQAEMRRLLVRAEEFVEATGNAELHTWLKSVAIALTHLCSDSIWVRSRGISERIDQLLEHLVAAGRPHPIFSLLPSQQEALREALLDPAQVAVVLQMPTSAGKTLLAEFAILQTLDAYRDDARIVYIVPTRALATQTRRTLKSDLGPLGVRCTGAGSAFEEDPFEMKLLDDNDGVVVSTPEKLDLMLRSHPEWFQTLRLVVVDEAHLLGDGERGARLELLLANLRREVPDARLLLLTPFMDNAKEIAEWLSSERGYPISVHWRPSKVKLGSSHITGSRGHWNIKITWHDPYRSDRDFAPLTIPAGTRKSDLATASARTAFLSTKFRSLGTVLALFSASPAGAEKCAKEYAESRDLLPNHSLTPELRLAIALAKHEFGDDSALAFCLSRGVSFHHSSLSPVQRYLIEDQVRAGVIQFVAATSTLAQGMNFPVATVVVHSIFKPYGRGNLTPAEFWNVAGRAGRVGMVDQGHVIFANENHSESMDNYSSSLRNSLTSAILSALPRIRVGVPIKQQYRDIPELRPLIQYLAHAAATHSVERATAEIEELLQQSLAVQQVAGTEDSRKLRNISRAYLQELANANPGMLKTADQSGLATFNFNELYAKLRSDVVLSQGPARVYEAGEAGYHKLIEALQWLPELDLAIGFGSGAMDVHSVARVVDGWIQGKEVKDLASLFPGDDITTQSRKAAQYLYGTISQTVSWGAHAYLRGWMMGKADDEMSIQDRMLPSYIQYGVNTPEAAVASLLGVPRAFTRAIAERYRDETGAELMPEQAAEFKNYVETLEARSWGHIAEASGLPDISGDDLVVTMRALQGLA